MRPNAATRSTPKPPASGTRSARTTWSPPAAAPVRWRPPTSAATWPTPTSRAVTDAIAALAEVPAFRPSVDAWLRPALEVCAVVAEPHDSLGIPTWHYGHEPSNVFATGIAKYFRNATREAILLEVCDAGIVFLPGAGGTVQEVFQDACENYYADESSVAEMVLVGRDVLDRDPARLAAAPLAGPRPPDGGPRPPRRPRRRGRRRRWLRRPARGSRSSVAGDRRGSARRAPR